MLFRSTFPSICSLVVSLVRFSSFLARFWADFLLLRPSKKHEFLRDRRQNHAFRCIRVGCRVGPLWGLVWALLTASWAHFAFLLGLLGAAWGPLGDFLGASWALLGGLLVLFHGFLSLGASWGPPEDLLGTSLLKASRETPELPGDLLGTFGTLLTLPRGLLTTSGNLLKASCLTTS